MQPFSLAPQEIASPAALPRLARWSLVFVSRHFAESYAARYKRPEPEFLPDAISMLRAHRWPGNVRELEHWIGSAIALAPDGEIRADLFPAPARGLSSDNLEAVDGVTIPLGLSLDDASKAYVEATLKSCEGNKSEAAKRLQVGRNSIGRWPQRLTAFGRTVVRPIDGEGEG